MDLFVTSIALKKELTKKEIYELIKKWIIDSPHYAIKDISYQNEEYYEKRFENISIEILNKYLLNNDYFAVRFKVIENDNEWRTDCIFSKSKDNCKLAVKVSCQKNSFSGQLPKVHKPHIIKMLIENKYCDEELPVRIEDEPFFLSDKDDVKCGKIMTGELNTPLPVVYVSIDSYCKNKYWVDLNKLAIKLSGIAHVLVEPNKEFSKRLRTLSGDNNAHNGYVGVYFPGERIKQIVSYKDYLVRGKINEQSFMERILEIIQHSLLNYSNNALITWEKLQVEFHKSKLMRQQEASSEAEKEYTALLHEADQENLEYKNLLEATGLERKELEDKVSSLQSQLVGLEKQNSILKDKLENTQLGIITKGEIKEFYIDEVKDCIISVLKNALAGLNRKSRKYVIIDSILKNNKITGEGEKIFREIKDALQCKSNNELRRRLEKCGFVCVEGAHDKYLFFNDPKYTMLVSKSPSDYREAQNLYSDIMKLINIYK